jgi:hypothetical protein
LQVDNFGRQLFQVPTAQNEAQQKLFETKEYQQNGKVAKGLEPPERKAWNWWLLPLTVCSLKAVDWRAWMWSGDL